MKVLPFILLLAALPALAQDKAPAACPRAAEQLPELLASAMQQRMHEAGEVRVEYEVTAEGRLLPLSIEGHRPYRTPVRIALSSLDCHAGQAQRYLMNVRFAGPQHAAAATVLATATPPSKP